MPGEVQRVRLARFPLLLPLVLLQVPLATGGTEDYPEWGDALGDQTPASPLTLDADMLAAWFHDETIDELRLTLKVNNLAETSRNTYELTWNFQPAFGVRVALNPEGPRWTVLQAADADSAFEEIGVVTGETRYGSPGYLSWTVPKALAGWKDGFVFWRNLAKSQGLDVLDPVSPASDEMFAANRDVYMVGWERRVRTANVPLPTRRPDMASPVDAALEPKYDLLDFWLDMDERFVNLTFRVRGLPLEETESCRRWQLTFHAYDDLFDDGEEHLLETVIDMYFGPPGPQWVGSGVNRVEPSDVGLSRTRSYPTDLPVVIQAGSPTVVRQMVPRAEWKLSHPYPDDNTFLGASVAGGCSFVELNDHPHNAWRAASRGDLPGLPSPFSIVPLALALAGLLATAKARKLS